MEHMDIRIANIHEPAMHHNPIFVRETKNSDGKYNRGDTSDKLVKKLWDGMASGNDYRVVLFAHLKAQD